MRDLERQPLHNDSAVTQPREEQSILSSLEKQRPERPLEKAKPSFVRWYLILGGTVLLVLAVIFASVFSAIHHTQVLKVGKQPAPTIFAPVSQPVSIPAPTATPLQTSGAPSHNLSTSLAGGIAYIGTANNAVYALLMGDGKVLWQQHIDGAVSQQPLVSHGAVYVNAFVGQDGPDYIYALQESDGRILWRFTSDSYTYLSSATGANSTLYVVSQAGISALQTTSGQVLWHFATQGPGDNAAVVDNGVVYVTSSADGGPGRLDALRASDGKLLWHYTQGSYISVSLISNHVVYITSNRAVIALRAGNGGTLWQYAIDADIIQPLQLVNGVIYTAGTKMTLPPAAWRISPWQRVTALSEVIRTVPARPALPLKEGISTVYAIRANDGAELWHYPLLNGANSWTSWLSVQNGAVYVSAFAEANNAANPGEIYALQSEKGAVIWHDEIQTAPSSALLANGVIYLSTNGSSQPSAVYALQADTGVSLWSYPISGSLYNASTLVGTVLYIGSDNGTFYALSAVNGALLWHYQTNVGA